MGYNRFSQSQSRSRNYHTESKKTSDKASQDPLCKNLLSYLENLELMLTNNTNKLYEFIDQLLSNDEYYNQLFGGTTKTAYRRIHDLLISILDKLEYISRQSPGKIPVELARAKTIIHYQAARTMLKKGNCKSADAIKYLDRTLSILYEKSRTNTDNLDNLISSTRTLLDAFVVIVERKG